ncbi:MAG TPA: Xaa-Pro peptidase family protein [Bryobacteraceae bacterium]|nr:Xaa-Pro peptidase family protein [Bryobacteraceae bacterium]
MKINPNRLNQLTDLMAERGWDLLLLYGHSWRKDFFRCLINANFSGPHAAAVLNRAGEVRAIASDPWDREAISANGGVSLALDFSSGLRGAVSKGAVAIAGMELMEARFVEAIRDAAGTTPVSATADVEELRRVKTLEEIEILKRAAALADCGYRHFAEVIEPGMSEYELVAEVEAVLKKNGAEDNFMLIASGGVEVTGMKPPTARQFQPGDSVTTELTPQVDGYYAQICRTLVLGEPSPGQRKSFAIFSEAQQAAVDVLRPGVNIADVARAQNDVFRKYGYGEYTGPKYTRVRGHNLGLHPDESPYVLEDVNYAVKQGMVVIAHPNTYLPLSGYMVFGDTLLVTADGCAPLNQTERKLFQR